MMAILVGYLRARGDIPDGVKVSVDWQLRPFRGGQELHLICRHAGHPVGAKAS
jgi:hypothetical protein